MSKPQWKTTELTPDPAAGESGEQLANMIAGKPYSAGDKFVSRVRDQAVPLLAAANAESDMVKRMAIMAKFINFRGGERNSGPYIVQPFTCEYGFNISIGDDVFIGPSCTFLDVCPIRIGDRTMIGANCQFYTPSHPILPEERDGLRGAEWGHAITIGDDVWLGGGVIICPGVTIGNGSTVGAGSVVTKDVEDRVVVAGNPARVIKRLPPPGEKVEKAEEK